MPTRRSAGAARALGPGRPLALALGREPGGGYDSFVVFRKLQQDVAAFGQALDALSTQAGRPVGEVGAIPVGRSRTGRRPFHGGRRSNHFHYDQDPARSGFPGTSTPTQTRSCTGRTGAADTWPAPPLPLQYPKSHYLRL